MSPLPWLETWLPVFVPLAAVVGSALSVRALLARLVPDQRTAERFAAAGLAVFGFFAGHDAIGPDLSAHQGAWGGAFGAVLALVGAGLGLWKGRFASNSDGRAPGGPAIVVLGLTLGLAPAIAWFAVERALAFDSVREVSESRAQWRRRLVPNDPMPWLALALIARGRDQNEHALAMGEIAGVLAPNDDRFLAELLELRSDVLATQGECEQARALFEEALAARARAALDSFDLDLSESYRLPRALAAECGWAPD